MHRARGETSDHGRRMFACRKIAQAGGFHEALAGPQVGFCRSALDGHGPRPQRSGEFLSALRRLLGLLAAGSRQIGMVALLPSRGVAADASPAYEAISIVPDS